MPLTDIMPMLIQKQRERTAASQKQSRVVKMTRDYLMLESGMTPEDFKSPTPEQRKTGERAQSYFSLAAEGMTLPRSYLKPEKQINWKKIYKDYKIPDIVSRAHRDNLITDDNLGTWIMKNADTSGTISDDLAQVFANLPGMEHTPEQLQSIHKMHEEFGPALTRFLLQGSGPKGEAQARAIRLAEITGRIDAREIYGMEDLNAGDKAFMESEFSKASLATIFDEKYNNEKLMKFGIEAIEQETRSILGDWEAPGLIAAWSQGNTDRHTQTQIDFLNETRKKSDGSYKPDAIISFGQKRIGLAEKMEESIRKRGISRRMTPQMWAIIDNGIIEDKTKAEMRADWKEMADKGQAPFSKETLELLLEVYPIE